MDYGALHDGVLHIMRALFIFYMEAPPWNAPQIIEEQLRTLGAWSNLITNSQLFLFDFLFSVFFWTTFYLFFRNRKMPDGIWNKTRVTNNFMMELKVVSWIPALHIIHTRTYSFD